jgi:streptogramin lyase
MSHIGVARAGKKRLYAAISQTRVFRAGNFGKEAGTMSHTRSDRLELHRNEQGHRCRTGRLACLMVLVAALLVSVLPQAASAETFALSKVEAPSSECGECMAIRVPTVPSSSADATGADLEGSGQKGGLDPKDLREAFDLPETGGSSQTVAIVDAYNDPYAESDLKEYRKEYKVYFKGTETECTEKNGCFKKIDVAGETEEEAKEHSKAFPENNKGWSGEISLDLDMVSAACPECHILLVEANGEGIANLGPAEEEAVTKKPTEISNSYGHVEYSEETLKDKYFDHPGIPIFASAGDNLYNGCQGQLGAGICYPAASQYVISVGGVKLTKKGENWTAPAEEVWNEPSREAGTGSGCSKYEPKPPGQKELPAKDSYCEHRLDNDVSADAAVESAVSVRDSYYTGGWENFGGTSASSPFVAGVEAHATSATRLLGADAFYKKASMLSDVTKGNNGTCTPPTEDEYFCTAETGYDGPTGEGTPDKVFTSIVPAGATGFATKVEAKGATLNGIVNPNGATTKYYFEYGTTESYGKTTAEESVGSGTSNLEESKAITGLAASAKYDVRIVTTNSSGTTYGLNQVFMTSAAKPKVETKAATNVTETGTTLNGTVNPEGSETKYYFEYGTTESYGSKTAEASAGAGTSTLEESQAIIGLTTRTTYYYRIVAVNNGGTSYGESKTFFTGLKLTEYTAKEGELNNIVTGPDGNLWFTEHEFGAGGSTIEKITTSGTITEYALPNKESNPQGITAGPEKENALWFTEKGTHEIGKITTSGTITEYALPTGSEPAGITAGPDGNLWFTEQGTHEIGKITTSGTITEYALPKESNPRAITSGPDGNLWFVESTRHNIGKITTSGTITEYSLPSGGDPEAITVGPDGNLWFTEAGPTDSGKEPMIGKITTSGTITEYSLPSGTDLDGIEGLTAGPEKENALWFTSGEVTEYPSRIGKISTSGTITEYASTAETPWGITVGPDGKLWLTGRESRKVATFTTP